MLMLLLCCKNSQDLSEVWLTEKSDYTFSFYTKKKKTYDLFCVKIQKQILLREELLKMQKNIFLFAVWTC